MGVQNEISKSTFLTISKRGKIKGTEKIE